MKKFYLTRDEKKAIPFILPGVAVTALLIIYPLFYIISMSFSENAIGQSGFAGLTNYLRLFKNPMFTSSIWNTLVWTLGTVIPAFLIGFILALYVSIIIVFIIHLIIIAILGLNPIIYVKNAMEPLILAFTSRSSLGTLPVTIEALTDKMGVDNGIASFVGSLGSNMGMNGCAAIYPALMAVTLANMSGTEMDVSFYGMLIVIIVIGSLGIAGLPGSATMAVSVAISGMGMGAYFPLAGGIIAIDPILDMGRTMLNVNGTMVTAVAVGKSFNKVDKEIYNKDK